MISGNPHISVFQRFDLVVKSFRNKTAIEEPYQSITFNELRNEAEHCAGKLLANGVVPGDCCTVCLPNSINTAIAILAVWRIGSIPVLINSQSPKAHIKHAIIQTQSKVIITEEKYCDLEKRYSSSMMTAAELRQRDNSSDLNDGVEPGIIEPTDKAPRAASVIFTSGSTGLPKGVMQSHTTLINCSHSIGHLLDLNHQDKLLCPIPWSFDYGFGQLLSTLLEGIPQILPASSNPFDICHAIEQHQPTVLAGVPSLFANLALGVSPIKETNLQSIRLVTNTGSAIAEKVLHGLRKHFTNASFSLNYGLTETYRSTSLPTELALTHPESVGYAVSGVDILILREDGTEAATGEIGQIVHCGAGAFMGYWNDEVATQKALKKIPDHTNNSEDQNQYAVLTGDLGHKDSLGLLYIHGRLDRQIKSMGVRVSPDEIENCLSRHPEIKEAAVIASSHEIYGEIITALVATNSMVPTDTRSLKQVLRLYCKDNLSAYMMPRNFICMDDLPRTASGKIDYVQLKGLTSQSSARKRLVSA